MTLDGSTSTMVIAANQWASAHLFLAAYLFVKNACNEMYFISTPYLIHT
jgi:hypothetical protein